MVNIMSNSGDIDSWKDNLLNRSDKEVNKNILYINNLNFLRNKEFLLNNYDPRFKIWAGEKILIKELERRGVEYSLDEYGYSMRIFLPNGGIHLTQWINYWLNTTSVTKFFTDKLRTSRILKEDWFNVPKEVVLQKQDSLFLNETNNFLNLKKFIDNVWYPVILKPNKGQKWEWIHIINNDEELEEFCSNYNEWIYGDNIAIAQEFIKWEEIRVIYLNWEILLAYNKTPFFIKGDGQRTIEDILNDITLDWNLQEKAKQQIIKFRYDLKDILSKDEKLQVFEYINEASDTAQEKLFDLEDIDFVKKVANSFWANYFWMDIITNGKIRDWTIIELNSKPDVLWARKISKWFDDILWKKVLESILSSHKDHGVVSDIKEVPAKEWAIECGLNEHDYLKKISSLKFLQNKDELLRRKTSIKHGIFVLLDALEDEWYPYWIEEYWFVISISLPNGKNRIIYGADYWFDSSTLRRIFEDKIYTSKILRQHEKKVADDMLVIKPKSWYSNDSNNTKACLKFADQVWYPLIFKPNDGSLGAGVKKIFSKEQLLQELSAYNNNDRTGLFMLQKYLPGNDYRVLYLDWEILAAYERIPAKIKWDWANSINKLIHLNHYDERLEKIEKYLSDQWISLDKILREDEDIDLLPTANVATWWTVRGILITEEDKEYIRSIANVFGARYLWVDIISNWSISDGYVLEINKAPITKWISEYSSEFRENFWKKIWQQIKKDEWF